MWAPHNVPWQWLQPPRSPRRPPRGGCAAARWPGGHPEEQFTFLFPLRLTHELKHSTWLEVPPSWYLLKLSRGLCFRIHYSACTYVGNSTSLLGDLRKVKPVSFVVWELLQ